MFRTQATLWETRPRRASSRPRWVVRRPVSFDAAFDGAILARVFKKENKGGSRGLSLGIDSVTIDGVLTTKQSHGYIPLHRWEPSSKVLRSERRRSLNLGKFEISTSFSTTPQSEPRRARSVAPTRSASSGVRAETSATRSSARESRTRSPCPPGPREETRISSRGKGRDSESLRKKGQPCFFPARSLSRGASKKTLSLRSLEKGRGKPFSRERETKPPARTRPVSKPKVFVRQLSERLAFWCDL